MKGLRIFAGTLAAVLAASAWAAATVAGVTFADATRLGNTELTLNGAGIRARLFFQVYAMGLYLPRRAPTPDAVLAQKGPKRIHIVCLRDLTADQFADALVKGIQHNHSEAETAALKPATDEFVETILSVKQAPKGTVILIDYNPDSGTQLSFEGKPRGKAIPGEAFYTALLKIWLGEHPAAGDLKDALLGRSPG